MAPFASWPLRYSPRSPFATGCLFVAILLIIGATSACVTLPSAQGILNDLSTMPKEATPILATSVSPEITSIPSPSISQRSETSIVETNPRSWPSQSTRDTILNTLTPSHTPTPRPVRIASDLIYLTEGRLMRWDRITRYSSLLAENVAEYTVDSSGMRMVLLRPRGIVHSGNELFDIELFDLSTKQITPLIQDTARLYHLTLSPDGEKIAAQRRADGGKVVSFSIINAAASTLVESGDCTAISDTDCTGFVWSPDSRKFLWIDSRGIWMGQPGREIPTQIHHNQVEIIDPAGQASQFKARYSTLQWSPLGRFVLTTVMPEFSSVRWQAVLDSRSGRLQQLLDTYEIRSNQVSVAWLKDGTLAVAHANDGSSGSPPTIQVFGVYPTNSDLLVKLREYQLFPNPIENAQDAFAKYSSDEEQLCLNWLYQQQEGHLRFGVVLASSFNRSTLYDLKLFDGALNPLVQLDPDTQQILWAPDGSGMLLIDANGQVIYSTIDGLEFYDLSQQLGESPSSFTWLPPTYRQ